MKLKIEYVNTSELEPYPGNAKLHPAEQVEQIKKSIQEFGFNDPVAIWKNNEIIEGHGRVLAALELGIEEIPIIRLDDLTDDERRAYMLVHNQLTLNSGFDYDLLALEVENLESVDLEEYGFDLVDDFLEHEKNAEETQDRVERILNLDKAIYTGEGYYDIPKLLPVYKLPKIKEWIGFNYVLSDDDPKGKAVHFFVDDYQFERIWNNPEKYVEKLKQYVCVATPDFSPYGDMPLVCQLFNHYRKHWVGAFLQANGVTVIPTVRASTDERSLKWYLDGEPREGIVLISSMWTANEESLEYFKKEYETMYETLNPCKVLIYGRKVDGLKGDIEYINTFTQKRWES